MRSQRPRKRAADGKSEDECEHVGALYEQYSARIAAYTLRRTNQADAADAVAETFLVAWRRRDAIPEEPMTLPWLYGVARRVLANQHRTHHRRTRLHVRLSTQFTQHHAPPARIEAADGYERVAAALNKLSDTDAELLRLSAWEALSPSEIAPIMGIEPEAARQRLHRARKRLRKQLAAETVSKRRPTRVALPVKQHRITGLLWELSDEGRWSHG